MASSIPDEDLAKDGRENRPHVTVLYGLHTIDPDDVRRVIGDFGSVSMTLGGASLFHTEDADVLKLDVDSEDLHRLNALLRDGLPYTSKWSEYVPHVTIAYLKPGLGSKWLDAANGDGLAGTVISSGNMIFSTPDNKRSAVSLRGINLAEHLTFFSDSTAPTDQVALAGPDGRRAAELLADAKSRGGEILNHLARRAVTRVMQSNDPAAEIESLDSLLNDDERAALASALAAVTATADLLGRSRVRERVHQAELRHTQHVEFGESDSFQAFVDPPAPLQPTAAIDYFKSLVPGISANPATFGPAIYQNAFTLAATADQVLLQRVKDLILGSLETGSVGTPQAIEDVLSGAGVLPGNQAYSNTVFRTAMKNSYQEGVRAELDSPMMDEVFPVWKYVGIDDGRERERHRVHFDKYFPHSARFADVRDSELGEFDGFNCRCDIIPISKFEWADLQANGAKFEEGW